MKHQSLMLMLKFWLTDWLLSLPSNTCVFYLFVCLFICGCVTLDWKCDWVFLVYISIDMTSQLIRLALLAQVRAKVECYSQWPLKYPGSSTAQLPESYPQASQVTIYGKQVDPFGGKSYPSTKVQLVYSTATTSWAIIKLRVNLLILLSYIWICVLHKDKRTLIYFYWN